MNPPIQQFFELTHISAAGEEIIVAAKPDAFAALAKWGDVDAVTKFEGRVTLEKLTQTRFSYDAELIADVAQSCVVTLGRVQSRIKRKFSRTLVLSQRPGGARETVIVSPTDDDSPEEIESTRFDLAEPLLEEFLLAIDPYPRAKGVVYEPPPAENPPEASPFAVLKQLKQGS